MRSSRSPATQSLDITDAAQRVQRSAYPDAYAQHEVMARAFASALSGQTPAGLDCSLRSPDAAGDPAAVTAGADRCARRTSRRPPTAGPCCVEAEGTQAWAVAQWAVANAKALVHHQRRGRRPRWNRQSRDGWQPAQVPAGQVRVTVADAPGT